MNYTLIVLLTYVAVMLGVTVLMTKKENNIERFCVGNRNSGWMVSALSIAATWIWAPALFISTENAYTKGFAGLFWFLVPNVLCLILFIPFAKKIREEMPEGITLSGYMYGKYHSKAVKNIYLFQLGMKPEEIFRLSEFSKEDFLRMMIKPNEGYSKAEFITKI